MGELASKVGTVIPDVVKVKLFPLFPFPLYLVPFLFSAISYSSFDIECGFWCKSYFKGGSIP